MQIKRNILILTGIFVIIFISLIFGIKKIFFSSKEITGPKVAIVIDDWGYNLNCLKDVEEIDTAVTISILPNLSYSSKIAEIARSRGQEVILHLPLEPEMEGRTIGLEKNTITSEMSEEEIIRNLRVALSSVPGACGVSNHMGSRATCNYRLMSAVFSELNKRKLFFLDNLVTDKSICQQVSKETKVKFISRDFFLDNLDDDAYIAGRFSELAEMVLKKGQAVAVGHARAKTLKALKDAIPMMREKGIEFVFVSDLIE